MPEPSNRWIYMDGLWICITSTPACFRWYRHLGWLTVHAFFPTPSLRLLQPAVHRRSLLCLHQSGGRGNLHLLHQPKWTQGSFRGYGRECDASLFFLLWRVLPCNVDWWLCHHCCAVVDDALMIAWTRCSPLAHKVLADMGQGDHRWAMAVGSNGSGKAGVDSGIAVSFHAGWTFGMDGWESALVERSLLGGKAGTTPE